MQSYLPFKCIRLYQSIYLAIPRIRSNADRVIHKLWLDFDVGGKGSHQCSKMFLLICFNNKTTVMDLELLCKRVKIWI